MIESSSAVIVAADGSKVGRSAFAKITGATKVDVLVTGTMEDKSELARLSEMGIRIIET